MSVVKEVRHSIGPEEAAPRLSQELPSQASGAWTRWAQSVIGWSTILAPSKAQPPAAAPGVKGLEQPFLRAFSSFDLFLSQAGSLKSSCTFGESMGRPPSGFPLCRPCDKALYSGRQEQQACQ